MMQIKVNAENLNSALECASVGGGKGFVLMVNPAKIAMGDKEVQAAQVSSSDGEKTALSSLTVHVTGMEEPQTYYAVASFKSAVASLSKISETLTIVPKGTYLEVSDEKKLSVVKIELMEKDVIMPIPSSPEGAALLTMEREKFVNAVKHGGYCAEESQVKNTEDIRFGIKKSEEADKMILFSFNGNMVAKSEAGCQIHQTVGNASDISWYMVNSRFINNMIGKLSGEMIQIAFAPKYMVVQTASSCFASKLSEGSVTETLLQHTNMTEFDYEAKINKRDLLNALEIVSVGGGDKVKMFTLETGEDGTLTVSAAGNKSAVVQKEFEGRMKKNLMEKRFKQILGNMGEELHYYGKSGEKAFVYFDGVQDEVTYVTILLPVYQKDGKKDKEDKK